jgi:hypothetical protein
VQHLNDAHMRILKASSKSLCREPLGFNGGKAGVWLDSSNAWLRRAA